MRRHVVWMTFAIAFVVLFGLLLISEQTLGAKTSVSVDVEPDTLNLEMHGLWITVYIELPEGYQVSDINMSTVKLNGLLSPERWDLKDDKLMMKFNADDVIVQIIWPQISHMGMPMPQDNISAEFRVTGKLYDGTIFEGSGEIRVIAPSA